MRAARPAASRLAGRSLAVGEAGEQGFGVAGEAGGGGFQRGRRLQVEAAGEAGRAGGDALGRQDEGEQLQEVEHRDRRVAEAAQRGGAVHHERPSAG